MVKQGMKIGVSCDYCGKTHRIVMTEILMRSLNIYGTIDTICGARTCPQCAARFA